MFNDNERVIITKKSKTDLILTIVSIIISIAIFFISVSFYKNEKRASIELKEKRNAKMKQQQKAQNEQMQKQHKENIDLQREQFEFQKTLYAPSPEDEKQQVNKHFEITPVDKLSGFLSIDKLDGLQKEKEALKEFILYIKNPAEAKQFGLKPPTGALFYGVPGTGKTTLARTLAKESKLPYIEIIGSEFSKKYVGEAPKLVKNLFAKARDLAEKNNGVIVCIDEAEGAFRDLSSYDSHNGSRTDVVNQFKSEMTSMKNNPDKPIFLIGTTNHINQIEPAIIDRFTYKIEVFLPELVAVQAALARLANKMKITDEAKTYLQNEMATKIHQHDELRSFRSMGNYIQKAGYIAFSKPKEQIDKQDLDEAFDALKPNNNPNRHNN
ncbi:ATP-binding protein [Candidatus Phytoplasma pruni]|uniref:ATP-binding protein n=1 Tax=Candidatus Phytoplasma pruni TaxID=479893 RepID=A0A851HCB2_9MOLU|nr:ATP-binding protein [Candidatus Phytoplasma pruni]NWN45681.1 ATP-binding protein [Candidatus Phytoplasma pruni]